MIQVPWRMCFMPRSLFLMGFLFGAGLLFILIPAEASRDCFLSFFFFSSLGVGFGVWRGFHRFFRVFLFQPSVLALFRCFLPARFFLPTHQLSGVASHSHFLVCGGVASPV